MNWKARLAAGWPCTRSPRGGLAPTRSRPTGSALPRSRPTRGSPAWPWAGRHEVKALGQSLIGEDPLRVEHLWDRLYTRGYQRGRRLRALSILDLALWDLIGKAKNEPVYHLLGGPCQERIRAYAAMLGFSTEPEAAAERSRQWVDKGFTGFKWYLPYNEEDGEEGLERNVALVAAVREAVGDGVDLMLDCILSNSSRNSLLYAIKLARRLEPYHPTWLEEPLNPDDLDAYGRLAAGHLDPAGLWRAPVDALEVQSRCSTGRGDRAPARAGHRPAA